MPEDTRGEVTRILAAKPRRGRTATRLLPLVYEELRKLARARLAHMSPGQTLQPTALVHEAYMRLIGKQDPGWDGTNHFFAAAALAMREILIEDARRKHTLKRGGDRRRVDMEKVEPRIEAPAIDMLALDEAVTRLEREDPLKGRIVNHRYFAGQTTKQTAEQLGISVTQVEREWRYIRTWLANQLEERDRGEITGASG